MELTLNVLIITADEKYQKRSEEHLDCLFKLTSDLSVS